jgi:hypothetical protein
MRNARRNQLPSTSVTFTVAGDDTRVARLAIQKAWGSEGSTTVTIATGFDGEGATS